MTSISNPPSNLKRPAHAQTKLAPATNYWVLQDAKARFSEVVRRVHLEGPQHVTVHGRDEVVIISANEFKRMKGLATGQALIDVLQAAPYNDLVLENRSIKAQVREVKL